MNLLKEVRIFGSRTVEKAGSEQTNRRPVLDIRLDNVLITNFQYAITPAEAEEQIEFRYSSISWSIRTVTRGQESLAGGDGYKVMWNGETNKSSHGELPHTQTADKLFEQAGF